MDITYLGKIERGVSLCVVGSPLWMDGYRYQRNNGASLVLFGWEWQPVQEWLTIEVNRSEFEEYVEREHTDGQPAVCGRWHYANFGTITWRRKEG